MADILTKYRKDSHELNNIFLHGVYKIMEKKLRVELNKRQHKNKIRWIDDGVKDKYEDHDGHK